MSDTPETDAVVGRHQKEIADLPMNPPIEVALKLSQRHCIELMSLAQNAERQRDALQLKLDSAHRFVERSADAILNAKAERDALKAENAKLKAELAADRERIDWIADNLFEHHWDGTIGRPSYWQIWSGYRHVTIKMIGNSFREAIDAAKKPPSGPHPSHNLRYSDSSVRDYVCQNCGASDSAQGWDKLGEPCTARKP